MSAEEQTKRPKKKDAVLLIEESTSRVVYADYVVVFPDRSKRNQGKAFSLLKLLAKAALNDQNPWVTQDEIIEELWEESFEKAKKRILANKNEIITALSKLPLLLDKDVHIIRTKRQEIINALKCIGSTPELPEKQINLYKNEIEKVMSEVIIKSFGQGFYSLKPGYSFIYEDTKKMRLNLQPEDVDIAWIFDDSSKLGWNWDKKRIEQDAKLEESLFLDSKQLDTVVVSMDVVD